MVDTRRREKTRNRTGKRSEIRPEASDLGLTALQPKHVPQVPETPDDGSASEPRPRRRGRDRRSRAAMRNVRMRADIYALIRATVGHLPAETEGMLGGDRATSLVTHFAFETHGHGSGASYTPDHARRNSLLASWNAQDVRLLGFVHSHPRGVLEPSGGDRRFAADILAAIPSLACLYLLIVQSDADEGPFEIGCWAATRDRDLAALVRVDINVVAAPSAGVPPGVAAPVLPADFPLLATVDPPSAFVPAILDLFELGNSHRWEGDAEALLRVVSAYDVRRLATSRVILVGLGGARAFAVDLARAGVREFVLIDPDVVTASNLATQYALRGEIGRAKVDCARDDIHAVSPDAVVVALQAPIEQLNQAAVAHLARSPWRRAVTFAPADPVPDLRLVPLEPAVTLLCGLSDSFPAQALVNRLAIDLRLPSLAAQMYRDGSAGEVTFTFPGVTPACHRCMLARRYEAYESGYRNDVTSAGAPIFATGRVNALTGFVALALLHHGTNHPRWGGLIERISPRTLVQVRMDPDVATSLGLGVFDRVFGGADTARLLFDEAVWLPQAADPACPDCGGKQAYAGADVADAAPRRGRRSRGSRQSMSGASSDPANR